LLFSKINAHKEKVMAKSYPQDDAFNLAPNAGASEDRMLQKRGMTQGNDIPDMGVGHVTANAMRKDWGSMPYSAKQDGDGSMNYMSEKKAIAGRDAQKLTRTRVKPVQ
jgi:hypothetical protein